MKNNGGPAFPAVDGIQWADGFMERGHIKEYQLPSGMSLRDFFAAAALLGIITSKNTILLRGNPVSTESDYAEAAFAHADAMLAQREKE